MQQGQDAGFRQGIRPRRSIGTRIGTGIAVVAVLVGTALVASAPTGPAGAVGTHQVVATAAPGRATTRTTVVSPTTTVTTTTRPQSVTSSSTTVTTTPAGVTSTTVTTVAPTATTQPSSTGRSGQGGTGTTTTTTTTVPTSTTTVPPTTTATTEPTTVPGPATFDSTCSSPATPGLQTYLDSLPAGSVFRSSTTACYDVPQGIHLRSPITIIGGTFYDPSTVVPPDASWDCLKPIISVHETSHVTLSGLTVLGANATGAFHPKLVTEAGIKLVSATDVTIIGVTAKDTWGDGLELVAHTPIDRTPVTGLTVDGFTTINAGRQGVTLAEVSDSTLNNVHIVSPADAGFDFESDIAGRGSDNVTISNCIDDAGFNMVEFLGGPITISDCTGFHHVALSSPGSNAQVTFVGGAISCRRLNPQPCINQDGGSLTFLGVAVGREAGGGTIDVPTWRVRNGGNLLFENSSFVSAFGTADNTSTVRIVK